MKSTRELLEDMLASIETIQSYSLQTYELFVEDDKTQDAIMYNLIILGEAANRISNEFQEEHSEIPWSSIIGTRNVVIHGYDQIKLQIVWDIISKNLGQLKKSVEVLLNEV